MIDTKRTKSDAKARIQIPKFSIEGVTALVQQPLQNNPSKFKSNLSFYKNQRNDVGTPVSVVSVKQSIVSSLED
jgi:hypothetical protein